MSDAKRQAERRGRRAEIFAALLLTLKGYAILARRFKAPTGEVDLIARRGRLLIFVEVKARPTLDQALAAVPPRAWPRIAAGADAFLSRRPDLAQLDMRYDILAVAGWRWRHQPGAWRPGD